MQYRLAFAAKSSKFLRSLDKKTARQVYSKLDQLRTDPYLPGSRQLKGQGSSGPLVRRIRAGAYQVLGDREEVLILVIGHRKDVYRDL